MIRELESQGVVSKTHSPFNSPIWPVRKSDGEWRLTVDYRALNEVTPPLSAAVPDMLELQYELESKAAKWYATIDIANAFFSIPLAAECRPQFAFTWRGVQYTWNRLPQGWKHSPTICHGLIQAALEKGEAPEHLQYIDDIIVWGNTAMEVFEKGEKIIQILLKAGFAIKKSKVKGPAREIQFLGVKWHDGRRQIPTEVINKITAMCPPTNKKETQAFLGAIGFWRMHIPEYSQIVSPLYLVTRKKNDFYWGPEQQQAFAQIKQEIAHAVALGPVRTGPEVKNVLYSAAGNNGLSWSLWQKGPGETRGRPLGFWSRSYRGSEANYTPTEKEILAAYEGVQAASEVVGTETQLLLAPRLPVLGWMFKAEVPSTHHATNATWSKWIALITQRARIGNPNRPGILEIITNWPEGENFGLMDEEEQEQVTRAEEAPPYNQLPAEETRYALFTDGSCRIIGMKRKWKAAVWSPTRQVAQATEGEGGSSQLAELKAVQLALDIAEREKWPKLYLYTDSWMVANALWGWLEKWKKANWQRRGKPIWAADEWKDIATRVEKLPVKVRHVDAHVPKSRANEEHQNNEQVDQAAKIEVSKIDLDWQHKGELFLARWAHDASGHQGRDATYKWARDRGVDLTMDSISQVIHDCETCAAIKQAKRVKPLWYGGRWSKYKYGEAWQIDYITLPQTRQGKRYVLTMVEATTGWLETYPVPHATARNTILGLEKQVLWRHGTPERIESDNGTHFKNSLINNWAREHGIEWVYHIPYHAPASGKIERYNGLLKTTLKALGGGSFKNWEQHLAKATWLVNTRGSTNRAGPAQSESLHTVDGEKVPVVHSLSHRKSKYQDQNLVNVKPLQGSRGRAWFVIVPLITLDIRGMKKELPPYLDDPIGVGEKIEEYLGNADYTWKDWNFLLGILFGSSEKQMILQKAQQLWEDEHPQAAGGAGPNVPTVDDASPQVDPQWNPNEETSLVRLHDYRAYLIRAIKSAVPRTNNIAKAMSLEQEKHESPSHWLERIREALQKHGGIDPKGPAFDTLLKVQFVTKAWPDIQNGVQNDEEWQNKPLEELVRKTQQIYVKRDEEKEAQLAQTLPLDFAVHNIPPGDWVLIKEWKEAPLVAKWHGPFQVLLTTETAVKTAEHGWTHHTQVKVSEALEIWTSQLEEKDGKP
ncbi:hypothetical protein DUI87_01191 [Hirundo rustica rustica]|uniref:ribonuclease H n=1 Tax=Hirundo rustica rustica TaxID=333673 RepID=A0A3M0L3Z5_HIRRU|nr:hypothetical protein DUI87_01191 [Hirundo rustica rustica]